MSEFWFLILSDTFRWVHMLSHGTTLLCVLEPPNYFPSTPFNVFISKFQFLKIPTFLASHHSKSEESPPRSSDLHLSDGWWCWASCRVLLAISTSSNGEMSFKNFAHFVESYWTVGILMYLYIKYLYFLPFCKFFSVLITSFVTQVFNFYEIQFTYFCFCCLCFWSPIWNFTV